MSRVVRSALERPEVGIHGLLAACGVALSDERSLVGIDLGHVLFTRCYGCTYCCEALTDQQLVRGRETNTIVRARILDEQRGAVRVGGSRCTVFTDKVRTAGVTRFLHRFGESAGYIVDTGCILNFCHVSK